MRESDQSTVVEPPAAERLLALVVRFLQEEIGPSIDDEKLRFRVRVAANLLEIARREIRAGGLVVDPDGYLITERMLASAGSLNALTESLLQGPHDILDPETRALLWDYVERKLAITAPSVLEGGRAKADGQTTRREVTT